MGSLAGLAVIGTSVWTIKKHYSKPTKLKPKDLTPAEIQNSIAEIEIKIEKLKKIISDNYISERNHIISQLNEFGEYEYKIPFENSRDLNSKIKNLEKQKTTDISRSTKIIEENNQIIRDKIKQLSADEKWKELKTIRKQLVYTLHNKKSTPEQKKIANEKISFVNDLITNMVYPEEAAKYKSIYGLTEEQTYELVTREFETHEAFMKEFDRIKDKDIPFGFDSMDKRFSHTGSLSLRDIFPEEIATIESNKKHIKQINVALESAKELYGKYHKKLVALAKEFKNKEEVLELKTLIEQLKSLKNSLN
jgi:hypothetical protein